MCLEKVVGGYIRSYERWCIDVLAAWIYDVHNGEPKEVQMGRRNAKSRKWRGAS